eukprot:6223481-Prymnesium_polylepis.1
MSFVHLINPNFMQKYDAEESCKYLVKMMPKGMETDGDLLTMELKSRLLANGTTRQRRLKRVVRRLWRDRMPQ